MKSHLPPRCHTSITYATHTHRLVCGAEKNFYANNVRAMYRFKSLCCTENGCRKVCRNWYLTPVLWSSICVYGNRADEPWCPPTLLYYITSDYVAYVKRRPENCQNHRQYEFKHQRQTNLSTTFPIPCMSVSIVSFRSPTICIDFCSPPNADAMRFHLHAESHHWLHTI